MTASDGPTSGAPEGHWHVETKRYECFCGAPDPAPTAPVVSSEGEAAVDWDDNPTRLAFTADEISLAKSISERQGGVWNFLRDAAKERHLRTARAVIDGDWLAAALATARAEAVRTVLRETCREWPDDGDRCNEPAAFILWGKLFPTEALGPRCYDHAVKHAGHDMPGRADQWAVFDLRAALGEEPT